MTSLRGHCTSLLGLKAGLLCILGSTSGSNLSLGQGILRNYNVGYHTMFYFNPLKLVDLMLIWYGLGILLVYL